MDRASSSATAPDAEDLLTRLAAVRALRARSRPARWLARPRALVVDHAARAVWRRSGRTIPVTARTFFGADMQVRLPEPVASELYLDRAFELDLTEAFLRVLRPGWTVFDVGAHLGYYTLLAARLVGAAGQVHAFEPTPTTFGLLARNTGHLPTVHRVDRAAWSHRTDLTFQDFGAAGSAFNSAFAPRSASVGTWQPVVHTVQAVSLDDYCAEAGVVPQFVKIDAESAENQVLAGMTQLIDEHLPFLTVEVGDEVPTGAPSSRELLDRLVARGYTPVRVTGNGLEPEPLRSSYTYTNVLLAPPREL